MSVLRNLLMVGALSLAVGVSDASAQDLSSLPDSTTLSSKDMIAVAQSSVDSMRGMLDQMAALQKKAEERGDGEAVDCVRDKLASARTMVDVSVLAQSAMQEALASGSSARAQTEYRKIGVALSKVEQFLNEALACLGEETNTGEVISSNNGDDGTGDDLADLGDIFEIDVEGPGCLTCTGAN